MAISLMVVALAWNLRHLERNSQIMLIGWFSLGVLLIDLAHTLSFPGMPPLVTDSTAQKAITFWLAGRIAAVIGFMLLALLPTRHWNPRWWLPGVAVVAVASLASPGWGCTRPRGCPPSSCRVKGSRRRRSLSSTRCPPPTRSQRCSC